MVVSYAKRFLPAVFSNKHEQWVAMWQQIADNNDLQKLVFCSGKQNYKDFNKNGIAQIVGFLINEYPNLFSICTYSNISEIVEGSKKHHMRIELGRHKNINETNKKKIKEIYKQIYTDTKWKNDFKIMSCHRYHCRNNNFGKLRKKRNWPSKKSNFGASRQQTTGNNNCNNTAIRVEKWQWWKQKVVLYKNSTKKHKTLMNNRQTTNDERRKTNDFRP